MSADNFNYPKGQIVQIKSLLQLKGRPLCESIEWVNASNIIGPPPDKKSNVGRQKMKGDERNE